jgi:hypothetical protein
VTTTRFAASLAALAVLVVGAVGYAYDRTHPDRPLTTPPALTTTRETPR